MKLVLEGISVAGPHEPLVRPTSFVAMPGAVTTVTCDPGAPTAALALAIGGRMPLLDGHIQLWGHTEPSYRQEHVVLVDVEDVSAPEDGLPVGATIREQLALAGQPSRRRHERDFLAEYGVTNSRQRWDRLGPATRTAMLVDLAARRYSTQVIVLGGPDRHGGEQQPWYEAAQAAASLFTVVLLCTPAAATHVGAVPVATAGGAQGLAQ